MSEWLPIESAPKDGTPVLISNRKTTWAAQYYNGWVTCLNGHDCDGRCFNDGDDEWAPTLWQPLPLPPKDTK